MTEFEGVVSTLGEALTKRGYESLTPVQEAVLAPELRDADALVSAQTGSGKTVAFGIALAPTLLGDAERFEGRADAPLALVVAPTRELALQVQRELEWLYQMAGASVISCIGGMDMRDERRALSRGAHIVVGTPGRLRDHIERGSLDTSGFRAVVLDEADEMLDLGFREDLEYILGSSPEGRRTLMFSATVPRSIANLAKQYQRNAIRVSTRAEESQHVDIEYRALVVAPNDRENAIINILRYYDPKNTLVFCATRATVNHMTSRLINRGFSVVALSGELSQSERSHALQAMRDGRAQVCVATDVAARGIDLPNLELVVHADIPRNKESLLHRSGRTGRAGRKGVCTLIVPHNWRKRTERLLQNAKIQAAWAKPPSVDDIEQRDRERILADPTLSEQPGDDELAFAQELLTLHGPEKVAAAFLRLKRTRLPAPEELVDQGPEESKKRQQENFKSSVWVTLSVGREQTAQPRWLLPLLCRGGHITSKEIGRINIDANETHVELVAACAERFFEAIGPSGKMDKNIVVTRRDGPPAAGVARSTPYKSSGQKSGGKKRDYDNSGEKSSRKPERKRDRGPAKKSDWKPDTNGEQKAPYKSDGKSDGKPERKPAHRSEVPSQPRPERTSEPKTERKPERPRETRAETRSEAPAAEGPRKILTVKRQPRSASDGDRPRNSAPGAPKGKRPGGKSAKGSRAKIADAPKGKRPAKGNKKGKPGGNAGSRPLKRRTPG